MDEAAQQLIHEFRHATASTLLEMLGEDTPDPQSYPMSSTPANQAKTPAKRSDAFNTSRPPIEKFSDLIITHGSESWNAHKLVICPHSPVLDAMISHLERDSSTLHLKGYDQEAMKSMMEYFYTTNYITKPSKPDFCLPLHTKVYILSSKLQIAGLQTLSAQLFTDNLVNHVTDLEVYFASIKEVYSETTSANPALRIAVAKIARSEMHNVLADEDWWERFAGIMNKVPAFQKDVMSMLVQHPSDLVQDETQELCEECGPMPEDDGYEVTIACKGCGVDRTLTIY